MQKRPLKVLSWNVWHDHKDPHKALKFIEESDADIVCLQEVSEEALEVFKTSLVYQEIVNAEDCSRVIAREKHICYLVILSKHAIIKSEKFKFKRSLRDRTKRVKEALEGHCVDIIFGNKTIRVLNVHLAAYVGPKQRIAQFKRVLEHRSQNSVNIIGGDLNCGDPKIPFTHRIIGRLIKLVVQRWFGISWDESWLDEDAAFKSEFENCGLRNALGDLDECITFPSTFSQLDFILVPLEIDFRASVIADTYGSDHYPIRTEIDIPELEMMI